MKFKAIKESIVKNYGWEKFVSLVVAEEDDPNFFSLVGVKYKFVEGGIEFPNIQYWIFSLDKKYFKFTADYDSYGNWEVHKAITEVKKKKKKISVWEII